MKSFHFVWRMRKAWNPGLYIYIDIYIYICTSGCHVSVSDCICVWLHILNTLDFQLVHLLYIIITLKNALQSFAIFFYKHIIDFRFPLLPISWDLYLSHDGGAFVSVGVGVDELQSEESFVCFGAKPTQRACARDFLRGRKMTRKCKVPGHSTEERSERQLWWYEKGDCRASSRDLWA